MTRAVHGSILALAAMALLLAGCETAGVPGIPGLDGFSAQAGFSPSSVGFEVDDEGTLTITSHAVTFVSKEGSPSAVATGFDVTYYRQNGTTPLFATVAASTFINRGALAHQIPAGITCATSVPCRPDSSDAVFTPGVSEPLSPVITLPGEVALEYLAVGQGAGVAAFTFYVITATGREVEIDVPVQVTYPVGGG